MTQYFPDISNFPSPPQTPDPPYQHPDTARITRPQWLLGVLLIWRHINIKHKSCQTGRSLAQSHHCCGSCPSNGPISCWIESLKNRGDAEPVRQSAGTKKPNLKPRLERRPTRRDKFNQSKQQTWAKLRFFLCFLNLPLLLCNFLILFMQSLL